jgi:uncharacterized protein (TIGR00290 family)
VSHQPTAIAGWSSSGGKDSMLALIRAREQGIDVRSMLTVLDESGERNRSHGVPLEALRAQADALGLELVMPSATWASYEAEFVATLSTMRARGHDTMVFGDIDLAPHREWEEKVCDQAGLHAVLPLWGESREAVAREVLARGIEAVVVCTDSRYLDDSFCGRTYDASFLADLPPGVCPCGENGEFHTFVTSSPAMRTDLSVRVRQRRPYTSPPEFGAQRYCFADIELR